MSIFTYHAFLWFKEVHVLVSFRRGINEAPVRQDNDKRPMMADVAREGLMVI